MDFSNVYLFSDIDGTLGVAGVGIPARNYDAIRRFVRKGGHFGLCTGRWVTDITHFVRGLPVNMPCIINNGAALCELPSGRILSSIPLPEHAMDYAREIAALDPCIQVIAVNESGYYCLSDQSDGKEVHLIRERFPVIKWDEFKGPALKFLFSCPAERGEELLTKASGLHHADVYYTWSGMSFEMIPAGISKGTGLLNFCATRHIPRENTVFIGDSFNDREMFMTAGFPVCVAGTPKELAALCRMQVGECLSGAVADLIEWLEAHPQMIGARNIKSCGAD
ncbi:MAG TPA: HAD hydrolase family protein [Candidatus Faecivivens stercoripullorum]|uniref:HAD hydrolase family protein n=1 Tax=Candidatus Faecivivens stercoripullorum TaxID=2840805 RepID=A0A9D1H793_9FIRM|nr:HAD hydrolase family protein [Candidatus Faecivivens stercoripullorum]